MSETKAEKRRARWERQYHSEAFVEWTKRQPCVVCGLCLSECAHNPSRGAGGTWRDVSPLCAGHHHDQHAIGALTFQAAHGINFKETNAAHVRRWLDYEEGLSE